MKVHYSQRYKLIIPSFYQERGFLKNGILNELSNGNFIGTPSILVKKSVIEKFLFDINLPALEDYDLMIRMASKINISFTNQILYEAYNQNSSITTNAKKQKKANEMMLNKTYEFDTIHRNIFNNKCISNIKYYGKNIK